ncbi:hypothetical protein O0I10_003606 [Lichtheimia ornata]|uniref:CRAL-TRIO domain-containing protein n=1 Tax=Lichtheimia ornata TaxID=688661 RepID=A0AAD7XXB6_9FUNG|nr:uncharacterized protein O0I10_003606 [Lichtheimia ornata]KAJ8660559.1 hypothetical protein O0I10_003606 [Lichtheimia ornata]
MFGFKSSSKDNSSAQSKASSDADQEPVTHDPILTPPSDYKPQPSPFLDESQQVFLIKIREYVRSIMLPEDHEYYASEKGFLTDATIIRYLRARKWDPEAAKIMLENTIKWRREYRPDQIDPEYIKSEAETGKMYFNGFDNCGRPAWIMRPRFQNSKDEDKQVKYIVFCLERGIRLMPPGVENLAIVVDFKDALYAQNPSLSTCKKFLDILGNHYPERLGVAYVLKSPWFFFTTFKLISPFMDPVTKAKIKFAHDEDKGKSNNSDWVSLRDYFPAKTLERAYGGTFNFQYNITNYWKALLEKTGNPYKVVDYL